jgi:hypothetical protein
MHVCCFYPQLTASALCEAVLLWRLRDALALLCAGVVRASSGEWSTATIHMEGVLSAWHTYTATATATATANTNDSSDSTAAHAALR